MKTISKFILIMAFVALTGGLATAQTPKIKYQWQTEFDKNFQGTSLYENFLDQDEDYYYLLIRKMRNTTYLTREYIIAKYDKKTLSIKEQKTIDPTVALIDGVYNIAGEAYAKIWENPPTSRLNYVARYRNRKHGFYKFNKNKMEFESLENRTDVMPGEFFSDRFKHYLSPDSSKILFVYSKMTKKGNVHRLLMLDKEMNRLWEKEVNLPFAYFLVSDLIDYFLTNTSFAIDNEGAVYLAGRIYSSKSDFDYQILKYDGEKFSQKFKLDMNGLNYHNCLINFDKNNNLFVVGFYSDPTNQKKVGGYYFTLDKNMAQAQNLSFSEIPLEHLYPPYAKNKKKSVDAILEEFWFYPAVYGTNGDIVMATVGAVNLSSSEMHFWGDKGVSSTRVDHDGLIDIFVFKIKPESGIAWLKRVPMKQKSSDRDKGNYAQSSDQLGSLIFSVNDNVVLLFNDHPRNINLDENSTNVLLAWGIGIKPMSVVIDANGKQKRQLISELENFKLIPEIENGYLVSENKLFITARMKTKSKLGVITVGK